MTPAFVQGWLMMAGLIIAIGAQNALVLRQGLARAHVGPVVAFCAVSDTGLILAGVFGFGSAVATSPTPSCVPPNHTRPRSPSGSPASIDAWLCTVGAAR